MPPKDDDSASRRLQPKIAFFYVANVIIFFHLLADAKTTQPPKDDDSASRRLQPKIAFFYVANVIIFFISADAKTTQPPHRHRAKKEGNT